jgi:PAS domain-containing protein
LSNTDVSSLESTLGAGSELCYESLVASATEPVLIIDACSGVVVEANSAVALLLHAERAALLGTPFIDTLEESSLAAVQRAFATARADGRAGAISVRARRGQLTLGLETALFHAAPDSFLLLRLTARSGADAGPGRRRSDSLVLKAIERAAVGFLITDAQLRVEYVNRALVQMLGLRSPDQVCGRPLAAWLTLGDAELARLRGPLAEHHAATVLRTSLCDTGNGVRFVEVHAVAVPAGRQTRWGFTLREQARLN